MKASWFVIPAATVALMFAGHANAADVEAGKVAFSNSICKGCHAVDYEGYGPSYKDVGQKYAGVAGAKEILTKNVLDGSKGVWGDENAMPPQRANVSDENLSAMLDYILSLK